MADAPACPPDPLAAAINAGIPMDGARLLKLLVSTDERTRIFSGWGLGGLLEPRDSAEFLVGLMARCTLNEAVPGDVREIFARVQKTFVFGLLDYDLFTVAVNETHLALEGALRARFVSFYGGEVPLFVEGAPESLSVQSFDDLFSFIGKRGRKNVRLADDPKQLAPRGYTDLYRWARQRGLLVGQRNVGLFQSMVDGRNYIAHPERHSVRMPPDVARLMRDAAEIINRLWGQDTPGGRLFPGPVARWVQLLAIAPDGDAAKTMHLHELDREDEAARWSYTLVLAAGEELLWDYGLSPTRSLTASIQPGFQTTSFPAKIIHGPCDLTSMQLFVADFDATVTDEVQFQDRTFYVRATKDALDLPRSADDVIIASLTEEPGSEWFVISADHPFDAFCAVRDHRSALKSAGGVELVERFVRVEKVKAHARQLLADSQSRQVPASDPLGESR